MLKLQLWTLLCFVYVGAWVRGCVGAWVRGCPCVYMFVSLGIEKMGKLRSEQWISDPVPLGRNAGTYTLGQYARSCHTQVMVHYLIILVHLRPRDS